MKNKMIYALYKEFTGLVKSAKEMGTTILFLLQSNVE